MWLQGHGAQAARLEGLASRDQTGRDTTQVLPPTPNLGFFVWKWPPFWPLPSVTRRSLGKLGSYCVSAGASSCGPELSTQEGLVITDWEASAIPKAALCSRLSDKTPCWRTHRPFGYGSCPWGEHERLSVSSWAKSFNSHQAVLMGGIYLKENKDEGL